ncbi:hypothetical protein FZD47_25545 [Bacillus infantis]|uniref:Uncharacterized protein n=1 Tax=Bacillus infantis TaxID=324767 RepID=A0A5D4S1P6_9BACI|nr:hypothetical protein [Bacillus infantis]TYS55792.1 hypothetical protein FZD47_25545 [Bacillus infantis]
MASTDKVYQLPYDTVLDKDIDDWLNSLPRSRKAEMVRNALRYYIQSTQSGGIITVNPSPLMAQELPKEEIAQKPKKRPNLPTDGNF